MNNFKGILFDLDGTLIETMEEHFEAWKAIFKEFNIEVKSEEYYPLEGMQLQELAKRLFEINNFDPPDLQKIVKKKDEYYLERYRFKLYPGVKRFYYIK
ncbi:unnamed protein product [marine sediment metagenome]|uniref:HAD family phosphatase n=1 Tax=marine sediment metagenome TaxID=412755 RepID=X1SLE8_9ZZZZ